MGQLSRGPSDAGSRGRGDAGVGLAKLGYGAFFCLVLPALLVLWARGTASWVRLPVPEAPAAGAVGVILGLGLVVAAMRDLWVRGGGLPMNAFPPERLVTGGVYRWLGQPIYVGAVMVAAGVSIMASSSSGLWFVTPVLALGAVTLTLGYERHDLKARFGAVASPLVGLTVHGGAATLLERLGAMAFVLIPWGLLFVATSAQPRPVDAVSAYLSIESGWPILPWTEVIYGCVYLAVPMAFLGARTRAELRELGAAALWATGLIGLLWWTLPFVAEPRSLEGLGDGIFVRALAMERTYDDPIGVGALPSFHVAWAFLAASVLRGRWKVIGWAWASLVGMSCVTTGMHAAVDVCAGLAVFLIAHNRRGVWSVIRAASEGLSNGWKEWRLGPVRLINHGFFGGLGALVGGLVILGVLGDDGAVDLWVLGLSSISVAGLWAQIVEGESVSLRPFGYYGAVVGLVLGGGLLFLFGRSPMEPWAAFAVASPWIQGIGRCRCLIQGCCHGQPCSEAAGIRVVHPRSRVVKLAGLAGRPIYPTQTYSILWNVAAGLMLYRLWSVSVPAPVLVGAYLMLAGAGRFVEESYRGEPQTPRVLGLPIYQWNATISFALGCLFTVWPGGALPPSGGLTGLGVAHAAGLFVVVTCLMGVDFPESTRRFGRLTK